MPGPKHPQPAQIALGLVRSPRHPVDRVRVHWERFEDRLAGVLDGVCGGETAEPVADPVGVTGPDEGGDAGFDDGREFREEGPGVCGGGS